MIVIISVILCYVLSIIIYYFGTRRLYIKKGWDACEFDVLIMIIPIFNLFFGLFSFVESIKFNYSINKFFRLPDKEE